MIRPVLSRNGYLTSWHQKLKEGQRKFRRKPHNLTLEILSQECISDQELLVCSMFQYTRTTEFFRTVLPYLGGQGTDSVVSQGRNSQAVKLSDLCPPREIERAEMETERIIKHQLGENQNLL